MADSRLTQNCLVRIAVVIWCTVLVLVDVSQACTCFCLRDGDEQVFGRNYDWHLGHGLVIVNKRNVAKRALLMDRTDTPAEWVSKYGSVTFNQYGREMPCGGMNEAGLVLETMSLAETQYPDRDARPAVMMWLQYQLDNCATVEEVAASDKTIRVATTTLMQIHFLGCDRKGNVATFEFLGGKLVCHQGASLPVTVLTNDTYDKSLAYLKQHAGFGGEEKLPYGSWGSLDRFVCAADRVKKYTASSTGSIVEYAFQTLESVSQGDSTKWEIVYDLKHRAIHYQTCSCRTTRTVRLADCDFDPETPVQVISINTEHTGLLNQYFSDYDTDLNRWMVYYSMKHTPQASLIPEAYIEILIQYPDAPATRFLTDWKVAGPYAQEGQSGQQLFDVAFDPERSDVPIEWRPLPVNPMAQYPAYLDIAAALNGGNERVAYLWTEIVSDRDQAVCFGICSDDGVKAWLNGELIHANNVLRGIASQPDVAEGKLIEGTNTLTLKVTQATGPWGAIVRMRPVDCVGARHASPAHTAQ